MKNKSDNKIRVVIVGAGFAGLSAAKYLLRQENVRVVLIDRNNYHTFQPLLYQVAAAELEAEEIANPIRGLFRNRTNISVMMLDVTGANLEKKILHTDGPDVEYDYLVLATGSVTNFFGTVGAEENAFMLKTLEDAVQLRNHLIQNFEKAILMNDPEKQKELTHTVIVGGGPNGVEYAGAIAELIRTPLHRDFHELSPSTASVTLLEAADHLLAGFPDRLQEYAKKRLEKMGVTVSLGAQVTEVKNDSVRLTDGTTISSATVVWTAGVRGNDLPSKIGLSLGRGGRVAVLSTLQTKEHPEIFVAGDLSLPENQNLPMVAPNAMQQGRHAAKNILRLFGNESAMPFSYFDKGALAVIGRNAAVAKWGKQSFTGFIAWFLWLGVHLTYLVGFHNRIIVLINWAWDYFFAERSVRMILPRKNRSAGNASESITACSDPPY